MEKDLLRDKSSVVSIDTSGYTTYMNQRRTMMQRKASETYLLDEINNLKIEVTELREQIKHLLEKAN